MLQTHANSLFDRAAGLDTIAGAPRIGFHGKFTMTSQTKHGDAALSIGMHRRTAIFWFALLGLTIACARVVYISLYGVETPFWDQWDAEAAYLLKPWQEGTWNLAQLFSSHNEHRIAITRVLSLLVFYANGSQWNNLVSAYINGFLAAAYLTTLFAMLSRGSTRPARVAAFVAILAAGVLPFSWENFLVGFQSQFYFMALLAVVAVAMAAFKPLTHRRACVIGLLAMAALFTSAGGLIGAGGVLVVLAARSWQDRRAEPPAVLLAVLMLAVILAGLKLTPVIPAHDILKAHGLADNVHALATALMWPVEQLTGSHFRWPYKLITVLVLWAPPVAWAIRVLRYRNVGANALFALGMSAWAGAQAIAIAHSRGHGMDMVPSRYTDIPAIAVAVNAWLAFELATVTRIDGGAHTRRASLSLAMAFTVVAVFGFVSRWHQDTALLAERTYFTGRETANVAAYMETRDPAWLQQPQLEIPYPNADRLKMLLDDPTVQAMLPPTIRAPGTPPKAGPLTVAATTVQRAVRGAAAAIAPSLLHAEPDTSRQASPQH